MRNAFPLNALIFLGAVAPLAAYAADPVRGDRRETVIATLGDPKGALAVGAREELIYPRGKVMLENDTVTAVALMTEQEFAVKERARLAADAAKAELAARDAALLAEQAKQAAAMRAERRQKGEAALNTLLASPVWKELSDEGRNDALSRFAMEWPETDLGALRDDYRRKAADAVAARNRTRDIEVRLADAEKRAADAETRARLAEQRASDAVAAANNTSLRVTTVTPCPQPEPQPVIIVTNNTRPCPLPHREPVIVTPAQATPVPVQIFPTKIEITDKPAPKKPEPKRM